MQVMNSYFRSTIFGSLPTNTTGYEIFKTLRDYLTNKCGLELKFCEGVCSDGATAMTARFSGVATRIKEIAPGCKSTHCFIHREDLENVAGIK